MQCRATQDWQVIAESFDKTWSTAKGNVNPAQYPCRENLSNCIKEQKVVTLKDEFPRSEGFQHAPGEEQRRTTNSPKKNEVAGPKQKQCSIVDVSGDESKI